jgi:GrpB-like predicted nucleotidyltransferase (UPF0157 family)
MIDATMAAPRTSSIVLADYDPAWPELFDAERERLLAAIGDWAVAIEHVGSTAIPGLAAKPIIDIGIALWAFEDALLCITPLIELGYECLGEYGIPRRIYFRKPTAEPLPGQAPSGEVGRTHQVHMYERAHVQFRGHIAFRDYLRANREARREYEDLKRRLAAEHDDVETYAQAKGDFVRRIWRLAGLEVPG